MGSEQEDLLDAVTVAEILGINPHSVSKLSEQGFLLPVRISAHRVRYRVQDVLALAEARKLDGLDRGQVALIALQARAIARSNEKKIQQLFLMLGADTDRLGVEEDDILEVYTKVCQSTKKQELEIEQVLDLARVFMAVHDDYLVLVKKVTGDPEPWRTFLEAAQLLCDNMPLAEFHFNKEKESAYGLLNAARRHLYHTCYFFLREAEGVESAEKKFPDSSPDYDNRIINYLLPFYDRATRTDLSGRCNSNKQARSRRALSEER